MTTIDPDTTLADVVTEHPRLARELERRGLDYCCGGRRTVAEASSAAGLDPGTVVDDLVAATAGESGGAEEPWASMGVVDLVDHIVATHHRYLWDELPRLTALVEKVAGVHGGRHPELADVARILGALRADVEPHLAKEERVLFPMVRELAGADVLPSFHCGSLARPISVMLLEHDRVGDLLAELRTTTGGFAVPADGCASFQACYQGLADLEADTHLHVHKENNLLFPAVVRLERERAGIAGPGAASHGGIGAAARPKAARSILPPS
jgi:regulator of cell morphogenesis and NO signaling